MKIAIDASKAINEKAGIARYTWEICKNLINRYQKDKFYLLFNFLRKSAEKKKIIEKLVNKSDNVHYKIIKIPGKLKETIYESNFSILNFYLKNFDLYHATDFLNFDNKLKIPQVLTVYDLSIVRYPEAGGKIEDIRVAHARKLKKACQKADLILSISEFTKKDIIKYYDISPEKIVVTPLGFNPIFKKITNNKKLIETLDKYNIKKPFMLFVSTLEPRKNIINLLKAFNKFALTPTGKNHNLILSGKKGWHTDEMEKLYQKLEAKERIKFLDYVPDNDLVYLYNATELFCYPSFFEGFGLPPLEAMACGAPVLISNTSSLPEVGGKAACYVNPESTDSIYEGMLKITKNKKMQNKMKSESLIQAKKFSWEITAEKTHEAYEKLIKKG